MKTPSLLAALCTAALLAGGCSAGRTEVGFQARDVGRPDAAWDAELRARRAPVPEWNPQAPPAAGAHRAQKPVDLSFQDKPVLEVVDLIRSRFDCEVSLSPAAAEFVRSRDLRVNSYASGIEPGLGFETLRGLLESQGLTVCEARNASTFGRPHFLVDRSAVVEASVPAR
jgi:hypothetical protein